MNREILFRGKRLDNGEWVEGDGIHRPKSINYLGSCWIDGMGERANDWVQVDPATVGQFTGLCDKNGVKIFEGDICNWKSTIYSNAVPYAVEYVVNDCRYVLKGTDDRISMLDELEIEVIGNIHDNPLLRYFDAELMEEEAE